MCIISKYNEKSNYFYTAILYIIFYVHPNTKVIYTVDHKNRKGKSFLSDLLVGAINRFIIIKLML